MTRKTIRKFVNLNLKIPENLEKTEGSVKISTANCYIHAALWRQDAWMILMDFFSPAKAWHAKNPLSFKLWKLCFAFIVLVSYVAKVWIQIKHIFGEDLAVKMQNKIIVNNISVCSTKYPKEILISSLYY